MTSFLRFKSDFEEIKKSPIQRSQIRAVARSVNKLDRSILHAVRLMILKNRQKSAAGFRETVSYT